MTRGSLGCESATRPRGLLGGAAFPLVRAIGALGLVLGFTLVSVPAGSVAVRTVPQTWHSQIAPAAAQHLVGDSCPARRDCFAVGWSDSPTPGAIIIATTDGGSQWVAQTDPSGISQLSAISCASKLDCVAVGYAGGNPDFAPAVVATTDGGIMWTAEVAPAGTYFLSAVSCPSSSDCIAVGDAGPSGGVSLTTRDGGHTWTNDPLPSGISALSGISCPTTTACTAVDLNTVVQTTDGAATWQAQNTPPNLVNLSAVSCSSSSSCVVVGRSSTGSLILGTSDGGHDWSPQVVPAGIEFSPEGGVSCPSPSDCTAVGQSTVSGGAAIVGTIDGGLTWSAQSTVLPALSPLSGVSCASSSVCTAVGQNDILNRGGPSRSDSGPFYLALGDSAPIWDGPFSYPNLLLGNYQSRYPGLQLVNLAVSGETTSSMLQGGQYAEAVQFLQSERRKVAFVTIDIGGNDVVGCALSSDAQCFPQAETTMAQNLKTILAGLHAAAPHVRIFGMTYYDPVLGLWLSGGSQRQQALSTIPQVVALNNELDSLYGPNNTADVQGAFSVTDSSDLTTSQWGIAPLDVVAACSWLDIQCPGFGGDDPNNEGAVQIATAFERVINSQLSGLVINTHRLTRAHANRPYSQILSASGGTPPYTWTLSQGSLPLGLVLDPATGDISGTPSGPAIANFTVQVADSSKPTANLESRPLSITVKR